MAADDVVRLNAFLARRGICSRREADRLIEAGRVMVNGEKAAEGMKVSPEDQVSVDGKAVAAALPRTVYALYKPVGYVCTTDTRWGDRLVGELIDEKQRLIYMGRLDKNSEGLILMTNDGSLSDRIMRAKNRHQKEYTVTVDHRISDEMLQYMRGGIWLEELHVRTRPCRAWRISDDTFGIVLTQGLNRQIRRMCGVCGYQVTRLVRTRIMNITLGTLQPGAYRKLSEEEIKTLC